MRCATACSTTSPSRWTSRVSSRCSPTSPAPPTSRGASGGTLMLDEIAEMPIELQVKLLRVLETGAAIRVGGDTAVQVDARVIAATNRPPEQAVADGKMREDLLYRLNVFPIELPPLR